MAEGLSLVNFGDLSKPATVLIEKISDAIGGIAKPGQIIRVAKAEAKAEVIRANAQIEIGDLHRRALRRFIVEGGRKQQNIESITQKAIPHLDDNANPANMEDGVCKNYVGFRV